MEMITMNALTDIRYCILKISIKYIYYLYINVNFNCQINK